MPANWQLEAARPEQREEILTVARSAVLFSAEEVATVEELIDEYIARGPQASGYYFLSGVIDGRVAGFACYGPRALTSGTYDLFWMAVDQSMQGRGLGKALSARTLEEVRALGGRLLVAETSGKADYEPTRKFYEADGWTREAIIADFYAPGDAMAIYIKRL